MIRRRWVFWDRKKGGDTKIRGESRAAKIEVSKALKWVPRGTKQAVVKPNMGLGTSPVLTDTSVGHYSGPSLFKVGESSLAGEGESAQVPLTADLEIGVSVRCAMSLLEVDGPFYIGSSSDEPSLPSVEADVFADTSPDEPKLPPGKADGLFYGGTSSDGLTMSQDKANGPFFAKISSVEPSLLPDKADDPFSVGTSSDEPTLPSG